MKARITPRVAFGATLLKGERHQPSGKAGPAVSLDGVVALAASLRFSHGGH